MTRLIKGKGSSRREGIEVLIEGVGSNCLVIGSYELVKFDGEKI